MAAPGQKVKVGVIYSDNSTSSFESVFLAKYIGAHLAGTGWSTVYLIGFRPGDCSDSVSHDRVTYYRAGSSKPTEAPASDLQYGNWSTLADCQVYISCINAEDAELCGRKISDMIESKFMVTVFCMQRGVRGSSELKAALASKRDFTVIECVVGFAVVPHPVTKSLISTTHSTGSSIIMMERLTKELVKTSDGPVNLVETMPFTFLFQKTLTTSSWGVLQFECIGALHAVLNAEDRSGSSSTIAAMMKRWDARVICAAMIREGNEALKSAAGGGKWKPDFRAVSTNPFLSPWLLEMMLVLPEPLFSLSCLVTGFRCPYLPSPGSVDLMSTTVSRRCYARHHLSELVTSGEKHKVKMPVCALVLNKLELLEQGRGGAEGSVVEESRRELGSSQSVAEILFWTTRVLTLLSMLALLYFLFMH